MAIIFSGLGHQDGWQASMPDISQFQEQVLVVLIRCKSQALTTADKGRTS